MDHKSLSYEYNKILGLLDKKEKEILKYEKKHVEKIKDLENKVDQ